MIRMDRTSLEEPCGIGRTQSLVGDPGADTLDAGGARAVSANACANRGHSAYAPGCRRRARTSWLEQVRVGTSNWRKSCDTSTAPRIADSQSELEDNGRS